MEWVPASAWLTKVAVDASAGRLSYDLAIDASGAHAPSRVAAGLELPGVGPVAKTIADASQGVATDRLALAVLVSLAGVAGVLLLMRYQPGRRTR